jgi:hypothetical protein
MLGLIHPDEAGAKKKCPPCKKGKCKGKSGTERGVRAGRATAAAASLARSPPWMPPARNRMRALLIGHE